jgi:hypothetical protein
MTLGYQRQKTHEIELLNYIQKSGLQILTGMSYSQGRIIVVFFRFSMQTHKEFFN